MFTELRYEPYREGIETIDLKAALTENSYTKIIGEQIDDYLTKYKNHYQQEYNHYADIIEKRMAFDEKEGIDVQHEKNKYFNESLADLVRNVSAKERISEYQGEQFIRFRVFPHQSDLYASKICKARLIAQRNVMSSNGLKEHRYVIATRLTVGKLSFDTQITLSDRSPLRFRMLLGRLALRKHFLIDPGRSHLQGRPLYQHHIGEK